VLNAHRTPAHNRDPDDSLSPIPSPLNQQTWFGCTDGNTENPRAAEWDEEFGAPLGTCAETAPGSGVFSREWSGATVSWDCAARHGNITRK
jgi:hypothetical protein